MPLAAALLQLVRTPPGGVWRAITAPAALAAIRLSVEVALAAAVLNAPLGLLVAWVLGRYRFPGRGLLDALVDLPLAIPGVVAGISFMSLFGPAGHVGRAVGAAFAEGGPLAWSGLGAPRLAGSRAGLVLAGLYVTLPFVVRTVQPVVATLDREAEEAAEVLGASAGQRFRRVILPQLAPAVVAAFGLAFARSVNEYGVAVLVSGNVAFETLVGPVYVYQRVEAFDYAGATAVRGGAARALPRRARGDPRLPAQDGAPCGLIAPARAGPRSAAPPSSPPRRRTSASSSGCRSSNVYGEALAGGLAAFGEGLAAPPARHAAKLTLLVVAIAVPANTAFGLAAAWVIARHRSVASRVARLAIDLPARGLADRRRAARGARLEPDRRPAVGRPSAPRT